MSPIVAMQPLNALYKPERPVVEMQEKRWQAETNQCLEFSDTRAE